MAIWKDKNGKRWRYSVMRQRRIVSGSADTLEQARELEARALLDLHAHRVGRSPQRTLAEAIIHYTESPQFTRLRSSAKLAGHLKRIAPFVGNEPLEAAPEVCDRFARATKVAPATANQSMKAIARICKLAYKTWRWVDEPVHERIQLLTVRNRREVYLTPKEVHAVLGKIGNPEVAMAAKIAVLTGMRAGEILALEPGDVRRGVLHVRHSKTGRPRMIPKPPELRGIEKRLPLSITGWTVSKGFKAAARAAGVGHARFHDLRHTTASWLVQDGAELADVRDILGHESIATTSRYSHLTSKRLAKVMRPISRKFRGGAARKAKKVS